MNILLAKIIVRLKIINLSVILNAVYLTAKATIRISTYLDAGSKTTVLCLGRPIFDDDIKAMHEFSGKINYRIIPKFVFLIIFNHFLGAIPRTNLFHTSYLKLEGFENEQAKYSDFLNRLFNHLLKKQNISAVITANYVYAWQQEIAKICLNKGIPFIVLQKEGLAEKSEYLKFMKTYTNNNFIGTKLMVYNDNIKNALLQCRIRGMTDSNIETIGIPRFDRYYKMDSGGQDLVFFSFLIAERLRHSDLSNKIIDKCLAQEKKFHIEVMKFASMNKDINVVIKTKQNERYLRYVVNLAKDNDYFNLNNLIITNTAKTYDLIKNSKCVIGFNSTTLIEGLISNKILISPRISFEGVKNWFDADSKLVNFANDYHDIKKYYHKNINTNFLMESNKSINEYVYLPDGKASMRAENSIIKSIESILT